MRQNNAWGTSLCASVCDAKDKGLGHRAWMPHGSLCIRSGLARRPATPKGTLDKRQGVYDKSPDPKLFLYIRIFTYTKQQLVFRLANRNSQSKSKPVLCSLYRATNSSILQLFQYRDGKFSPSFDVFVGWSLKSVHLRVKSPRYQPKSRFYGNAWKRRSAR